MLPKQVHRIDIESPEFQLAVRRARILNKERIRLTFEAGTVKISSGTDQEEIFEEQLDCRHGLLQEPLKVILNPAYLEAVCGLWPLALEIPENPREPIVVGLRGDDHRVLVMGMADGS